MIARLTLYFIAGVQSVHRVVFKGVPHETGSLQHRKVCFSVHLYPYVISQDWDLFGRFFFFLSFLTLMFHYGALRCTYQLLLSTVAVLLVYSGLW